MSVPSLFSVDDLCTSLSASYFSLIHFAVNMGVSGDLLDTGRAYFMMGKPSSH